MSTPRIPAASPQLAPVVLFPAFHFTRLLVTVENQTICPDSPASGSFESWFLNDTPSSFSPVCRDRLMTLVYDPDPSKPMPERLSEQPGVTVKIQDFGTTKSAPFYEYLYQALEAAGSVRDRNIRVAGYDGRLTPDLDGFLDRTIALIESTFQENGETPVHLVGHSNGPLYALYLLQQTSEEWKKRHIHGFTALAGNWTGQGFFYALLFNGLNLADFTFPQEPEHARSSARMHESHPSTYLSAADPVVFGRQEIIVRTPDRDYTPADNLQLFQDAGLTLARELGPYYIAFVKLAFPNVDVYVEKGSGIPTIVGVKLPNLEVGQLVNVRDPQIFFNRRGDRNQEDITNDAIQVWKNMSGHRFELNDNPHVDHFTLPSDPEVLRRLVANLRRPRSIDS